MTESEFKIAIEQEISWLRYYALKRDELTESSNLYDDLISIGYTKRVIPLWDRCPKFIVTGDMMITEKTRIEDLKIITERRNTQDNKFTPLEVLWMDKTKRDWIIRQLN